MKKASEIMYRIANVFIWVEIVLCILFIVLGILGMVGIIPDDSGAGVAFGLATIIPFAILLIINIIVLFASRNAARNASNGNKAAGPHILMLVLGVISGNAFFILGGIFGIVSLR